MKGEDDGFVLIDALVATIVVSIVGAAAFNLGNGFMTRSERMLDRALLLTNLESRAHEVLVVGATQLNQLPPSADGVFAYVASKLEIRPDMDAGRFVPIVIEARELGGNSVVDRVELLSAKRGAGHAD